MDRTRVVQVIVVVFVAGALLWPVAGERVRALIAGDPHGCDHAADRPDAEAPEDARAAVLCLLNHEREGEGLEPLIDDRRLEAAAQAHAEDMAERDFFAHDTPDGVSPDQRIRREGFGGDITAENLAWAAGPESTPAEIVDGWMNSPGHRRNILDRRLTRVGTGIAEGAPEDGETDRDAAVYVNAFGG